MKDLFSDPITAHEQGIPAWQLRAEQGIRRASENEPDLTELGQKIAVEIAMREGTVSADDVRNEFDRRGVKLPKMRNFMGACFKRKFEALEPIRSKRAESHGHWIQLWRLKA